MKLSPAARKRGLPSVALLMLLLVSPCAIYAQQLATVISYTFDGVIGTPTATAPGVTGSEFIRDDTDATVYDNTAGNPVPDTNSNSWTVASAADARGCTTPLPSRLPPGGRAGTA